MDRNPLDPLLIHPEERGLVTDLYQLTMWAAYRRHRQGVRGVFELWFRELPPQRGFLIFAGLAPALGFLQDLRFTPEQVRALRELPAFSGLDEGFFRSLEEFRFSCDVWAMPEGTPVFAGEPVLRVEGPIEQAQLVETYLLAAVSFSTLVASKAARVRLAAGDPLLWQQILLSNRDFMLSALEQLGQQVHRFREAIRHCDAQTLLHLLAQAKRTRDALGS